MKYLKRFFNWLFSFWLLDEKENKIEEIPKRGIAKKLKELPPEVLKNKLHKDTPKDFGQYFFNHKMPKYLKKKK